MNDLEIILTKNRGWFPCVSGRYVLIREGVIQGHGFDSAQDARRYVLRMFRVKPIFQEDLLESPKLEREERVVIKRVVT